MRLAGAVLYSSYEIVELPGAEGTLVPKVMATDVTIQFG